ncbi:baseplate J-like protein [Rhodobiaceae bacterium]|nr:baseplate J-like protein [Rhodobiaceae bacterium]
MSRFDDIDLSKLGKPNVIVPLDFETALTELKADYAGRYPDFSADLESEPLVKLMETAAYREVTLRGQINDDARAVMLAFAEDTDLDHIGARFAVARKLIDPGDANAIPPIPPTPEKDEAFRRRIQLAPEALSVAGPRGGYIFNALTAGEQPARSEITSPEPGIVLIRYEFTDNLAALAKDSDAYMSNPGEVTIVIMGWGGTGVPSQETLDAITAHLNDEHVRPLGDTVIVRPVEVVEYAINATLETLDGPAGPIIKASAEAALAAYVETRHRIGLRVTESGLHEALTVPGVEKVVLNGFADIAPERHETAHCTGFTVDVEAVNV